MFCLPFKIMYNFNYEFLSFFHFSCVSFFSCSLARLLQIKKKKNYLYFRNRESNYDDFRMPIHYSDVYINIKIRFVYESIFYGI